MKKKLLTAFTLALVICALTFSLCACGFFENLFGGKKDGDKDIPVGTYAVTGKGTVIPREYFGDYEYPIQPVAIPSNSNAQIVIGENKSITLTAVGTHTSTGYSVSGNSDWPVRYYKDGGIYLIERKLSADNKFHPLTSEYTQVGIASFNLYFSFTYEENVIKLTITYKLAGDETKGWAQTFSFEKK